MRIIGVSIVVIALASQAAMADIKRHASIPEALWGSWAPSQDGCKGDAKPVIVLAAKAYTSAEAKCGVDWVSETAGARGPIYSARLRCSSQPSAKASISNVIIRPDDAKQISIGPDFSKLKAYQKCDAKQ